MAVRRGPWPPGTPCWVDLSTADVAASCDFYGAVVGWSFTDPFEEYGGYVNASAGGEVAAGIGPTMGPDQPTAWTVYFAVTDDEATAAAITGAGGTVLGGPFDVGPLGRMTWAADPAGARFGLWQAGSHHGSALYNAPGGLSWEDGWVGDLRQARDFYATVFGFTYTALPGMDDYVLFATDGGELGALGATDGPPHWAAYFGVQDVDAAVAAAVARGATVVHPVDDTPFGRLAELVDPLGAGFKLSQAPAATAPAGTGPAGTG